MLNNHIKNGLMNWEQLPQLIKPTLSIEIEYIVEGHTLLHSLLQCKAPLILCRSEGYIVKVRPNLPLILKLRLTKDIYQPVEPIDDPSKLLLNILRPQSKLGDETVNLIYEEYRLYPLTKRLPSYCLSLDHNLLNSVNDNHSPIYSS